MEKSEQMEMMKLRVLRSFKWNADIVHPIAREFDIPDEEFERILMNHFDMSYLENMHATFEIAEKDLDLRGPGEFFGLRQHGLPQLKLADPVRHLKLAEAAGRDAAELLAEDPALESAENHLLASKLQSKFVVANELTL